MKDIIEKIGNSIIQHGKSSNRIYLMKLDKNDYPQIINHLQELAELNNYSKFFVKIPSQYSEEFLKMGFKTEAKVPGFYNGNEDALFLSKFLDIKRASVDIGTSDTIKSNIDIALKKSNNKSARTLQDEFSLRKLEIKDSSKLAKLYKAVFKTYPFPIFDYDYLEKTMRENIIYFGIFENDNLIAASSCETDPKSQNVEMTDFATHPDYRGYGFGVILLSEMEEYMRKNNFLCSYTIARAMSAAMNITFAKLGYKFAGTLINNTDISGNIESMNVWYKNL